MDAQTKKIRTEIAAIKANAHRTGMMLLSDDSLTPVDRRTWALSTIQTAADQVGRLEEKMAVR